MHNLECMSFVAGVCAGTSRNEAGLAHFPPQHPVLVRGLAGARPGIIESTGPAAVTALDSLWGPSLSWPQAVTSPPPERKGRA